MGQDWDGVLRRRSIGGSIPPPLYGEDKMKALVLFQDTPRFALNWAYYRYALGHSPKDAYWAYIRWMNQVFAAKFTLGLRPTIRVRCDTSHWRGITGE